VSEGELAAAFERLARDASQAGGDIAGSIAKFTEDTANIEDTNVDRTLAVEQENADAAEAIGRDPDPKSGSPDGGAGPGDGFPVRPGNDVANSEVDSFIGRARDTEPRITNAIKGISEGVSGSELAGLGFRLKNVDSVQRKVRTDLLENPNLSAREALSQIKDSVRYTMKIRDDGYVDGVREARSRLQAIGYENVSWKNTWGSDGYRGINSAWRDPASGQVFEVQFHTPDSLDARMTTHALYERIRLPDTPPDVRQQLTQQQGRIFAGIPVPPGAPLLRQP
jgi:hypothetical protein